MNTYIALLRGINVSGQKKIRMEDLKNSLITLGWDEVKTYIQSGNLIIRCSDKEPSDVEKSISEKIKEDFGFEVVCLVLTVHELGLVINSNPFASHPDKDIQRTYVTFLSDLPSDEAVRTLMELNYASEEVKVFKKVVYFFSLENYGKAKMNNNFLERKLKVKATTRNWKTVTKLYQMSK